MSQSDQLSDALKELGKWQMRAYLAECVLVMMERILSRMPKNNDYQFIARLIEEWRASASADSSDVPPSP